MAAQLGSYVSVEAPGTLLHGLSKDGRRRSVGDGPRDSVDRDCPAGTLKKGAELAFSCQKAKTALV